MLPPAAAAIAPESVLLRELLAVSLTGIILYTPMYDPAGSGEIVDFTFEYLNPAAQRMMRMPEVPTVTHKQQWPQSVAHGTFQFHVEAFESGEPRAYDINYQADGYDNYYRLAARRVGHGLLVSFTDTADQPRTAVEEALRESQAAEKMARAEAEQQRQRFYEVLMQLPAYVAVYHGPEHVYQLVNPPYQSLFPGRSFAGRPFREGMPEASGLGVVAVFDHVYQTGEPYFAREMEGWFDFQGTGQPEQVFLNLYLYPLRSAQGQVDGVLDFSYDVTEQVRARQQLQQLNQELEARVAARTRELTDALQETERRRAELRQQQRHLQQILGQAPAAIATLAGPDHRYTFFNDQYLALSGRRARLGAPVADVLPEVVDQGFTARLDHVYATGEAFIGTEAPVRLFDETTGQPEQRFIDLVYQPLHDGQNQTVGILAFLVDVTDKVLARRASEASARQLRLVTDALPVLIAYLDRDLRYRFANRAYQPWFGWTPDEMLGRSIREVAGEQAFPNIRLYLERALAGERVEFEAEMPFRPHLHKHIRTTYIPDVHAGSVQGLYTLVSDISDQVEARRALEASAQHALALAQELATANQQLTRTNVDLDNFIYTASHDLKAPITNIEGLLDTLRYELPEPALTGEVAHILDLMKGAVERFKRTIDHLTEVSKLHKEHDPPIAQVALAPVLDDVRLDLATLLRQTGGRLEIDVQHCPPLQFSEKNLRSVVFNLLSNALKYRHPDRAPLVQVRTRLEDAFVVLEVQDNGLGLDLAREHQVFAMFQRLHAHVEGSGLGLYMVKRMVENAAGKITVHSQVGEGTTFAVWFPR